MTHPNLQNEGKALCRGKFIALGTYISKEDRSKINDLSFHLKNIEKQEEVKP